MDGRKTPLPEMGGEPAKELCDRRFGIGGDGLILALPPQQGGDVRMQILNADGTEALPPTERQPSGAWKHRPGYYSALA